MPITPDQMKNLADFVQYLNGLEEKVNRLENENLELVNKVEGAQARNQEMYDFLKDSWPKTNLFSDNFWVRALTIFGHNLVISLILTVILTVISLLIAGPFLASLAPFQ